MKLQRPQPSVDHAHRGHVRGLLPARQARRVAGRGRAAFGVGSGGALRGAPLPRAGSRRGRHARGRFGRAESHARPTTLCFIIIKSLCKNQNFR